ncbi:hypothetical protein C5167_041906 [Papaver somniferum]|nr:hypothetical protein C5167_041906 [Papaver somniferum]
MELRKSSTPAEIKKLITHHHSQGFFLIMVIGRLKNKWIKLKEKVGRKRMNHIERLLLVLLICDCLLQSGGDSRHR